MSGHAESGDPVGGHEISCVCVYMEMAGHAGGGAT